MLPVLLVQLAIASLASAHFGIEYPSWRADSLTNKNYSQWVYPCAGVNGGAGNVTEWPLSGGSLLLDLHHPWTYLFVNLGLGTNVTNFNMTLTPMFLNETGNGTLCLPKLTIPSSLNLTDGTRASLQVVALGNSGSALYNCADIILTSAATTLDSGTCKNDTGVTASVVSQQVNGSASPAGPTTGAAPGGAGANLASMSAVVALTVVFVFGIGL